jgi:hypothetical protein
LKHSSNELIEILQQLFGLIWANEIMPDEFKIGIIRPLHKKGDPMQCSNYRGVTLLNTKPKKKQFRSSATRHGGAWGRGDIAPTHSNKS